MTLILINPTKTQKGVLIIKVSEIKTFIREIINFVKKKFYVGINYNIGHLNLQKVPKWCDFVICQGEIVGKPHGDIKFYTDEFATRNFNQEFFRPSKTSKKDAEFIISKLINNSNNNYKYDLKKLLSDYDTNNGKIFDVVYISRAENKRNIPLLIEAYYNAIKINKNIKICLIHTEHKQNKHKKKLNIKSYFNQIPDEYKQNFLYFYIVDDCQNKNSKGEGMFENNGLSPTEISKFLNLSKTYYFGEEILISKKYGANRTLCEALCCGLKILCFEYNGDIFSCSHKYINNHNSYQFSDLLSLVNQIININHTKYENIEEIKELREEYTVNRLKYYMEKYFNITSEFNKKDNLKFRITCHSRDEPWYNPELLGGTSAIKTKEQILIFLNFINKFYK